jgi:hypothetical protein
MPYRDSDSAGARMTVAGRELLADTREAIRTGRSSTATLTDSNVGDRHGLEREAVASAAKLRQLMVIGVLFATALVALLVYFQWLKLRHERVAREAQEQTRDILGTVKEGLFPDRQRFPDRPGALERAGIPVTPRPVRRARLR